MCIILKVMLLRYFQDIFLKAYTKINVFLLINTYTHAKCQCNFVTSFDSNLNIHLVSRHI